MEKEWTNFHHTGFCPIRDVLSRLGDKWSMLVLVTLSANGTMRFREIFRTIADISERMLTVTLRTLEEDGLVARRAYAEVPPRVEYRLTEKGESLMPRLTPLIDWAVQNMPDRLSNR
jgi:DNA-binding HxlR family transcriptional regulator